MMTAKNNMNTTTWKIGDIKVTSVIEIEDAGKVIQKGLPDATKENVSKISWLAPHFADREGNLKALVQVFVVETRGACIIVDPCVGKDKVRTELPEWNNLHTDFLSRLEDSGYRREKIDMVLCTHLHFDHVGWNTVLVDGKWVPTFTHARYLFVEKEFSYWKSHPEAESVDDRAGFSDSVLPVFEAGLVDLVSSDHTISQEISLIPTPGHTPGHVSIFIQSGAERAVISGDTVYHPCQIANPDWGTPWDTDREQARASRKALFERFADTQTLFIGSHFAAPWAGYLRREGDGYKFVF